MLVRCTLAGLIMAVAFVSAASAEVLNEGMPAKASEFARICESARLTDVERRECRAAFKTAVNADARQDAYEVFYERINGPAIVRR